MELKHKVGYVRVMTNALVLADPSEVQEYWKTNGNTYAMTLYGGDIEYALDHFVCHNRPYPNEFDVLIDEHCASEAEFEQRFEVMKAQFRAQYDKPMDIGWVRQTDGTYANLRRAFQQSGQLAVPLCTDTTRFGCAVEVENQVYEVVLVTGERGKPIRLEIDLT